MSLNSRTAEHLAEFGFQMTGLWLKIDVLIKLQGVARLFDNLTIRLHIVFFFILFKPIFGTELIFASR
jgi:hypothetical protein